MTSSGARDRLEKTVFHSLDVPLFQFSDAEGTAQIRVPPPMTAANLLRLMRERIKFYGSPLPGVTSLRRGIDIEALLKQIPWPPTT
jgi:hypothetical protein